MTSSDRSERLGGARAFALAFAAALLLLLPGLGRIAARESTDARYLEAAREMWRSGDWLVPRLAGLPHLDKPPGSYWSGAAGLALLGPTPLAGRLLQQLALAATAGLVFAFGRARIGARGAAVAAGVLLTSALVFGASRALSADVLQLLFLTAALISLYEAATRRSTGATVLGGACLGLSMWAKGPIALFVALAVLIPFLVVSRLRLPARGVVLGVALFLALGLPWYALLVARDPSLLDYFVERQLLSRITPGGEGHVKGLFHLPFRGLLAGLLPWTPLVALAFWRLRPRRARPRDPLELYLWLWALAPFLFFELFATKLATYLLPCFPGAALLVGRALETGRLADAAGRRALAASAAAAAGACALAAGLLAVTALAPARAERWLVADELAAPWPYALALVLGAAVLLARARAALRPGGEASLAPTVAAVALAFVLGFNALAAPLADHAADARLVRSVPGARVIVYGDFRPGLLFYLDDSAELGVAVYRRFVRRAKGDPAFAHLALRHEEAEAWMQADAPAFALVKRSKEADLTRAFDAETVRRSRHYALLANAAALRALAAGAPAAAPPL